MAKTHPIQCNLISLLLALMSLTGCGQGGCKSSFSMNINGNVSGWKTMSRTENGVTRKLETTPDVDIQNGQVAKFPPLAVIKLEESGGKQSRIAELRENAGKLELWIKDNGTFRRSTPAEDAWLNTFLLDISK